MDEKKSDFGLGWDVFVKGLDKVQRENDRKEEKQRDPEKFYADEQTSSKIMRSIFNDRISSKWDQFLTLKNQRDTKGSTSVPTPPPPAGGGNRMAPPPKSPEGKTAAEKLIESNQNKIIAESSKEQVTILGDLRDEMKSLNKGVTDILKKGIRVDGTGLSGGGGDGGGGFDVLDMVGGGGKGPKGGKPSIRQRMTSKARNFTKSKGGKFAIGAALLGAGAWGLSKLFGGGDEDEDSQQMDETQITESPDTGDYAGAVAGAVAPTAVASAGKAVMGAGAKTAAKEAAKVGGKSLFKSMLKKIPGVGAVVGTGLAIGRAMEGDYVGALGEFASGVASLVPGIGTAASAAIDVGLAIKDVSEAVSEQADVIEEATEKQEEQTEKQEEAPSPEEKKRLYQKMFPKGGLNPNDLLFFADEEPIDIEKLRGDKEEEITPSSSVTEDVEVAKENRYFESQASELSEQTSILEDIMEILDTIKEKMEEGYSSGSGLFGGIMGSISGGVSGLFSGISNFFGGGGGGGGGGRRSNPQARMTAEKIAVGDLGDLSAQFESANDGSDAIGWDSTGGTSYGKYQISSKTMPDFLKWAEEHGGEEGAEVARRMREAGGGSYNTGSKRGATVDTWRALSAEGKLGDLEHQYIKSSHFDPAFENIQSEDLRNRIEGSKALQNVLWSTAVQHGAAGKGRGAADIFNKVYREGMTDEELVSAVYADRRKRFGSSTPAVQASAQNRFTTEETLAQEMLVNEAKQKETAPTQVADAAQPSEVSQPSSPVEEEPEMSFQEFVTKKTGRRRFTREADLGLGDDYWELDAEYEEYLENRKKAKEQSTSPTQVADAPQAEKEQTVTPQVTTPPQQSGVAESVRIESQIAQQQRQSQSTPVAQSSTPSGANPNAGNMAGPISDGGYDKLTAVARGDTV